MADYFHFMEIHRNLLVRAFFVVATAVDLLFLYAALFNRNLPPRLAQWFFGSLTGMRITLPPPSTESPPWWIWPAAALVFILPPAAWIFFELHIRHPAFLTNRFVGLLLWRGVPTIIFPAVAIPLALRLIHGVIPPGEGLTHARRTTDAPRQFWLLTTVHLFVLAILGAWLIAAWCVTPPM